MVRVPIPAAPGATVPPAAMLTLPVMVPVPPRVALTVTAPVPVPDPALFITSSVPPLTVVVPV